MFVIIINEYKLEAQLEKEIVIKLDNVEETSKQEQQED